MSSIFSRMGYKISKLHLLQYFHFTSLNGRETRDKLNISFFTKFPCRQHLMFLFNILGVRVHAIAEHPIQSRFYIV